MSLLTSQSKKSSTLSPLLNLEGVDLARVFQRLSPVAEPHSHDFPVIVQLPCYLSNLLTRGQGVFLKVGVENLYGLWRETCAPLPFFGRFAADKLHQILLAFLVPVLGLSQPLLQHWLQLLGTLGCYIQLLESAVKKEYFFQ